MRTTIFLFAITMSMRLFAQDADLFTYDQEQIEIELSRVTAIENQMLDNSNFIFADESNPFGGFWIGLTVGLLTSTGSGCFIGALPGFIVGTLSGSVAVLLTYLTSKDNSKTTYAAVGCLVGSGMGLGLIYTLVTVMRAAGYF